MEAKLRLRKLGVGELLSEGWQQYRVNFINIFLVILCVYIPINTIIAFINVPSTLQEYGTWGIQLYGIILYMLKFFIDAIATIGIAFIIENSLHETSISWSTALRYGLSKWFATIGTGFLAGLIIFVLTLLLIVPGIIWSLYYSFWIYVVALRNVGGKTALDYSKGLVQGRWWDVFGTLWLLGVIGAVVGSAITYPLNLISDNQFFGIIPNTIIDIVGAFFTVVTVIFFLNLDYRQAYKRNSQSHLDNSANFPAKSATGQVSSAPAKPSIPSPAISKRLQKKKNIFGMKAWQIMVLGALLMTIFCLLLSFAATFLNFAL
jgi:hypothetical protein